mmetsp:Transcript_22504/g.46919  ORF Transcript_22504/g.46919 Transcript_22504/m.46919 type:complete len:327 (-) Transcript_22504:257-1237(-)
MHAAPERVSPPRRCRLRSTAMLQAAVVPPPHGAGNGRGRRGRSECGVELIHGRGGHRVPLLPSLCPRRDGLLLLGRGACVGVRLGAAEVVELVRGLPDPRPVEVETPRPRLGRERLVHPGGQEGEGAESGQDRGEGDRAREEGDEVAVADGELRQEYGYLEDLLDTLFGAEEQQVPDHDAGRHGVDSPLDLLEQHPLHDQHVIPREDPLAEVHEVVEAAAGRAAVGRGRQLDGQVEGGHCSELVALFGDGTEGGVTVEDGHRDRHELAGVPVVVDDLVLPVNDPAPPLLVAPTFLLIHPALVPRLVEHPVSRLCLEELPKSGLEGG